MSEKRVLVVEDDEQAGRLIADVLEDSGYLPELASNGKEAFDIFQANPYPVVITDIEMPIIDGNELIQKIRAVDEDTVVIVTSGHQESSLIIDVMKKGVYDYLVKPFDTNILLSKTAKAMELSRFRKMENIRENEKKVRIENQLEWYRWHENFIKKNINVSDKSFFKSLKTSFTQGSGFGSMIALTDIVFSSIKRDGDKYIIDASLLDLLRENADVARKGLEIFSEIDYLDNNDLKTERIAVEDYFQLVKKVIASIDKYKDLKDNKILISDRKPVFSAKYISIQGKYLEKAIYELIINALKFSEEKSNVIIMVDVKQKEMITTIINEPEPDNNKEKLGIPAEYENIIFEPFYRIKNVLYDKYDTLELGLGLTLVEKIIKKHNGRISLTNILDHSNIKKVPESKVCCEIIIPLKEE